MIAWTQDAAALLLTFALHSTLLLACVLLFCRLAGGRWPGLQETLCRLCLWAALASTALQRWAWNGPTWFLTAAPTPAGLTAEPPGEAMAASATAAGAAALDGSLGIGWAAWLLLAAGVLAAFGLGLLLRDHLRLRWLLRDRQPETAPRVLQAAADVAAGAGLRQTPRLSTSHALGSAIAFGSWSPEICLPARAEELAQPELRAMLAHELAHLCRRDPLWLWLGALLQALVPWQLLLRPLRRRQHLLAELHCDAMAAVATSPTTVARCLVQVADWWRRPAYRASLVPAMAASPSGLRQRVDHVLRDELRERVCAVPRPGQALALAALAIALLTAAVPGVADVDAHSPPAALTALRAERRAVDLELHQLRARLVGTADDPVLRDLLAELEQRLQALTAAEARLAQALTDPDFPLSGETR